jgi:hypothetical protein
MDAGGENRCNAHQGSNTISVIMAGCDVRSWCVYIQGNDFNLIANGPGTRVGRLG